MEPVSHGCSPWTMVKFQHSSCGYEVPISAQMWQRLFPSQLLPSGLLECPQDMAACLAHSKTKNEGENVVAVFLDSSSAVTLPIRLRVHWCNDPDSFGKCQEQNLMYALIATM